MLSFSLGSHCNDGVKSLLDTTASATHQFHLTVFLMKQETLSCMCLFQILYDEMGSIPVPLLHPKVHWLSREKARVQLFELHVELVCFSWNTILIGRMTDRQMLVIHSSVFGRDFFLKKNKVSLLFQGKQLSVSVTNDKILFLKQKLKFWKTFIHYHDCGSFLIVKYFSNETQEDISKCDFFDIV